jgi:putative DNA primase/helicase
MAAKSTLEAAREYIARGFSVIPLHGPDAPAGKPVDERGKRPAIGSWKEYQSRHAPDGELIKWFADGKNNIGIVTGAISGITVVDFDTPEAIEGAKTKGFPKGPLSKTAKGYHAFCKYEPGHRNFQKRADLPGIDLRAEGGYVVATPSIHATGKGYVWVQGRGLDMALPCAPEWLFARSDKEKTPIADLYAAEAGSRNESLARLLGSWLNDHKSITLPQLVDMAALWNNGLPSPLPMDEVQRTCQSIFGKHHNGESGAAYQWPEPSPLPEGLPPVKPLDAAMIPAPLRGWLMDIADRMQIPPDFSTAAAVVSLGSIIGRGCGIYPKRHDDWLVVPNIWGAVVGRPSLMKTPAVSEAQRPLNRLETEARDDYRKAAEAYEIHKEVLKITRSAISEQIKKAVKSGNGIEESRGKLAALQDDEPVRRRYQTQDGTTEKIGELLIENPRGLLINRDELIGWFKSLDRDGREGDRAFYLEAWNGNRGYTYDRIGRGTLDISALCVSIFGAITPGPLSSYVYQANRGGNGDDGLLQRFQVFVWPDAPEEWTNIDRFPDTAEKNRAWEIFKTLSGDIPGTVKAEGADIPALRFSPGGQDIFNAWRHDLETRLRGDHGLHPAMESHLTKYRKLMPSLALIFHLVAVADGSTAPGPVSETAAIMAAAWCDYLESHAGRIYGAATMPGMDAAKEIIKHIRRGAIQNGCTVKDIYKNHWARLTTSEEAKAGLEVLTEYDWLTVDKGNATGRPSEILRLNPMLKL